MSQFHRHSLRAWPSASSPRDNGGGHKNFLTARQLFNSLDHDKDGYVAVEDVVAAWPLTVSGATDAEVKDTIARFADAEGSPQKLSWSGFRDVVRLWHVTGGHIPSLRHFVLSTVAEVGASSTVVLVSAQAAALTCAAVAGPDVSSVWPRLAAIGGLGAAAVVTLFDASCVQPLIRPQTRNVMPAAGNVRHVLFIGASASTGVLLAPAVPVVSGTIGDPRTNGYGPAAVASLSLAHTVINAALLASLPRQCIPTLADCPNRLPTVLCITSMSAGLVTAALGSLIAQRFNRSGAVISILAAAGLVTLHAAAITVAATRAYAHGMPEPLRASLFPLKRFVALGAWAFRWFSSGDVRMGSRDGRLGSKESSLPLPCIEIPVSGAEVRFAVEGWLPPISDGAPPLHFTGTCSGILRVPGATGPCLVRLTDEEQACHQSYCAPPETVSVRSMTWGGPETQREQHVGDTGRPASRSENAMSEGHSAGRNRSRSPGKRVRSVDARSGDGSVENVGVKTDGGFQCPECRQRYTSETAMRLHLKYHHDQHTPG